MKKIFLIITIGLFTISAFAQDQQKRHEVSIYAGGGISSLQYDVQGGDHKIGFGGLAGVGYNFFFNYNWSLGIGAEFSLLQAKADFGKFNYNYKQSMIAGSYYNPGFASGEVFGMTAAGNYEDRQQAYYLNVPLKLQYQVPAFKSAKFYAAVGAKLGYAIMPAKSTFEGQIDVTGYELNNAGQPIGNDAFANLPHHGFGEQKVSSDKKFDLADLNVIGTVEAGFKWKAGKTGKNAWYTGLFFDYGFCDVRGDKDLNYFVNGNEGLEKNSVIESNLVGKVNTMTAGVKVAYAFGFGKWLDRKVKAAPVEKPFEGVTPQQMEEMLNRNTGIIVDAMDKNFAELKEMLKEEEPELFEAVPTDALSIVQFDFDKDNVKPVYYPDIDRKVEILKRYPQVRMTIIGHTDNRGSDEYNYQLGLERAQQVKDYMVKHGIDASRLFVESRGEKEPKYPNDTDENRYKNRRAEFELKE